MAKTATRDARAIGRQPDSAVVVAPTTFGELFVDAPRHGYPGFGIKAGMPTQALAFVSSVAAKSPEAI
jgi:hypothetical protein